MLVLTADQRHSRRGADLVDDALELLTADERAGRWERRPERTAGDEVQGVLADPADAVELVLALVRDGRWSVGLGVGEVRRPLPRSARAGAGPAYEAARTAVTSAKGSPTRLSVVAATTDPRRARAVEDAEAVLGLLAAVVQRRTPAGWEAVDLVAAGLTRTEAADRLGITPQALSQRLLAGSWPQEERARRAAAHLLSQADGRMEA